MLAHLTIRDLALVEHVELDLQAGLNVLTGETGAGKSVLVGALGLVLGARASPELVRCGAEEARVEALFDLPDGDPTADRLEAAGFELPDRQLLVARVVRRRGKGRVTLNGHLATVGMLAELMRGAIDLTSQHEHVALLDPERHLEILDAFGGLAAVRAEVEAVHAELSARRRARTELETDERARARRRDYLRYAIDEIEAVGPVPGELERLLDERRRLRHLDELAIGLGEAESALYSGDGAVIDVLGRVTRRLDRLAELDAALEPEREAAAAVLAEVEELSHGLGRRARSLEAEPGRLGAVEERIDRLEELARKHGPGIDDVLRSKGEMTEELETLEGDEARREALMVEVERLEAELGARAERLSALRRGACSEWAEAVQRELEALAMGDTRVELALRSLPEIDARGAESAELMIAPNLGEPLRPLRRTASGGELSRVLLAVKHALAGREGPGTLVYDEIDTGVGGAVADVLGAKLGEAGRTGQVIVVTHLPQVAAHADAHFRVYKQVRGERAVTDVERLSRARSVEELARMLGGTEITPRTRALAEELRRGREGLRRSDVGPEARALTTRRARGRRGLAAAVR